MLVTTDVAPRDETTAELVQLIDDYHVELFAYVYRLVDDSEWAHDLTQQTFLQAFQARGRLPEIRNRRAWLYRIATNVAFQALKRRRRFVWLPWQSADELHRRQPDIADEVSQRHAVEAALATLPPDYRAPLLLHIHYGLRVTEVAEALGLSETAVKTRLYRARRMFLEAYSAAEESE